MSAPASGFDWVDLGFLGHRGVIATGLFQGADGVALVDPGPSTTLPALEAGLRDRGLAFSDVRDVLLTHIHLDHAGASGSLLARCPDARVHVHARGAKHMVDPSRLLSSATRLYGDDMDRLWGPVEPVPAGRLSVLEVGGDGQPDELALTIVGRDVRVAWTPGHASHHVTYFLPSERLAFVGDTAGICRPDSGVVLPATPPPDVDLAAWRASAERILAWQPDTLFLTHFGPRPEPRAHFDQFWRRMEQWDRWTADLLDDDSLTDEARAARFAERVSAELSRELGPAEAGAYAAAGRFDYSWLGLARSRRTRHKADSPHT